MKCSIFTGAHRARTLVGSLYTKSLNLLHSSCKHVEYASNAVAAAAAASGISEMID